MRSRVAPHLARPRATLRAAALVAAVVACCLAGRAGAESPAVARARWGDRGDPVGGTVFFLALPRPPQVAAVGAAHSFDRARLAAAPEVVFELARTQHTVSRASRLLAPPGLPFSAPGGTLRDDLVLFALDSPPSGVRLLEPGSTPDQGARVTLLGVPNAVPRDQDDVFGRVIAASDERIEIELDVMTDLRGWGGAPVLDGDGRVVGVLQAAWPSGTTLRVAAAPIAAVLEAAANALDGGNGRPFASFPADAPTTAAAATPAAAGAASASAGPAPDPPRDPTLRPASAAADDDAPTEPLLGRREVVETGELFVSIDHPAEDAIIGSPHGAFIAGRAIAPLGEYRRLDVMIVLDTSGSTMGASGADINGNGIVGEQRYGGVGSLLGLGANDPGDSILAAEVAAARRLLSRLDPRSTRVGLATFAGSPRGGAFFSRRAPAAALTEVPLTTDYEQVLRGLERVLERGPDGMTHMAAGADQATIELKGLRGSISERDPEATKIALFLTDGEPTLPCGSDEDYYYDSACRANPRTANVQAVLRAAERGKMGGVRFYTFGVGPGALERPLAIVQLAEITGGRFTPVRDPARLGDVIDEVDFANVESVVVRNVTTDTPATRVQTGADGSWSAMVPLAAGRNVIEATARTNDGREAKAELVVNHAPGAEDPDLPPTLVASRNRLLELELADLRRKRVEIEAERAEAARKELLLEIERERAKAARSAEEQRKSLELEVEDAPAGGANPEAPTP